MMTPFGSFSKRQWKQVCKSLYNQVFRYSGVTGAFQHLLKVNKELLRDGIKNGN